ncbi:hypothetical protein DUNSADRAFT_12441 [Dunaliella salina]|uniref:FAD-binding domain-containing protein n=1 Tax=Dunaliella salina TaxID=3046 RepID=A0ABQ7H3U8_DUNSA|nr:hypothetical protein DUNSADRAFT_12441 [Dunaliella salina]|eukprot:KAF5841513.1 hypothetical protein DUNSADRAFT_12441 [Dunaliella salina]
MLRNHALSGSATHKQHHAPTMGPLSACWSGYTAEQQAEQLCSIRRPHPFQQKNSSAAASRCPPLRSSSLAFTGTTGVLTPRAPVGVAKQIPVPQLTWPGFKETLPGFKVVIAGAGIAGLTLALGLLKQGIRVQVLERDMTAVRGEGKLRGPIQVGNGTGTFLSS